MTLRRDWIGSPNHSSRGGATVTRIVLHTAEGARTYRELGNFFANPASGVSSHTGIDSTPGVIGEYVTRDRKAWTAGNANPWSIQVELCAFAEWSTDEWFAHPVMLSNCARWIAEEAEAFGIPIVQLDAAGAQDPNVRGVCQHNDLGSMGGGHWDCGPGFPIATVLELARTGAPPQPEPEPPAPEVREMAAPATCTDSRGRVWVFFKGGDNALWARCDPDRAFTLGGNITDAVSAVPGDDGALDVFAYTPDGTVWARHSDGRDWGDWYPIAA